MPKDDKLPRYLRQRDGAFYVRMGVPTELRAFLGRSELHESVGSSRASALRKHHAIVARFQAELETARQKLSEGETPAPAPRPAALRRFATRLYDEQVDQDNALRTSGALVGAEIDPRAHTAAFSEGYTSALREVVSGVSGDERTLATVGWALAEFDRSLQAGTPAWRDAARKLAGVQLEVLGRVAENDQGAPQQKPQHPLLRPVEPGDETPDPVPLLRLLDSYLAELAKSGKGAEAGKRWKPVFKALIKFLGFDDATRITKQDVIRFKEHLGATHAQKTIRDVYIGSLRAVLQWAEDNERITVNPARGVKVRVQQRVTTREKGFTEEEAKAIIRYSLSYEPKAATNPSNREGVHLTRAKRWVPLLCAHTGARVAEITQLRKQDVLEKDGIAFIRITPDAGSVKTGQYRDVPLHPELIELGFLTMVAGLPDGALFYADNDKRQGASHPSKHVAGRISVWLRQSQLIPKEVDPSHGWRHRFKTVARERQLDPRVIDAIQGHAPRTAGESYGDVTLRAKAHALQRVPPIGIQPP